MPHPPHQLSEEFPEYTQKIQGLVAEDAKFRKLVADYDEINQAIHLAETEQAPTDTFHEEEMRKKRVLLKDLIWAHLRKAA